MCSVYGIFDFEGDTEVNYFLKRVKTGKMYVTQHAVLMHEGIGSDICVAVESALGNIYTIVIMGKGGIEDISALLNCYLENGEKSTALLKGRFSFLIYDERQKSVYVARLKNSREEIFYSVFNDGLHISAEKGKIPQGQKVFSLQRGESLVYGEGYASPKIIDF